MNPLNRYGPYPTSRNLDLLGPSTAEERALVPQVNMPAPYGPLQSLDSLLIEQIFNSAFQAGGVFKIVQSHAQVLKTGNQALENDIIQIKAVHLLELNAAVDSWGSKTNLIAVKLKKILNKLKTYSAKVKDCGRISIETSSLQDLIHSLPDFDNRALKKYPEHSDNQTTQGISKEETTTLPSLDELLLTQTHPLIQGLMQSRKAEIESLTEEINLLQVAQTSLKYKKKTMIDFHGPFMEKLNNKVEKELGLKKILETAHSILAKIKWNITPYPCPGCARYSTDIYSPYTIKHYHDLSARSNLKDLKILQEKVEKIMSFIEGKI